MKNFLPAIVLTACLSSCGQSAEEIAAKEKARVDSLAYVKQRDDSIKLVAQNELLQQQETQRKEEQRKQDRIAITNRIDMLDAEIEAAKTKLADLKEFQIGRSRSEKDAQIKGQVLNIKELERERDGLRDRLAKLERGEDYMNSADYNTTVTTVGDTVSFN